MILLLKAFRKQWILSLQFQIFAAPIVKGLKKAKDTVSVALLDFGTVLNNR